jgi:hypothetical protein
MDTLIQNQMPVSRKSFFLFAAYYSFFVSCGTAIVAWTILAIVRSWPDSEPFVDIGLVSALVFFIFLSSLVMGLISLFGIPRHGVRPILWKAALGIVLSLYFGFYAAVAWGFSQFNFRC